MLGDIADRISRQLNRGTEVILAALMVALVLDVWIGVVDRYFFHWQLPWPEVLARYLMIWAAMLAVSSGIARREHIGLTAVLLNLPAPPRRPMLILPVGQVFKDGLEELFQILEGESDDG